MSYQLWRDTTEPGHCVLVATRIKDVGRLHLGEAVPEDFGQRVAGQPITFSMSDLAPDDFMLSDNYDVSGQIVVSRKLRDALAQALSDDSIQYLPAAIKNHKGRIESSDYFIVHPHRVVDCIDLEKSQIEWNRLNPSQLSYSKGLIIDAQRIPPGYELFRLKHWGARILASSNLTKRLLDGGFVGLRFVDPATYTGIG